jgi:hypothetical protein
MTNLQTILRERHISAWCQRPAILLEAIQHLQFAGLVISTANQPGDDLNNRRYWRIPANWRQE